LLKQKAKKSSLSKKMEESNWPQHVGIIMDGNGRWANGRGWKRLQGHVQGADKVISIVDSAIELKLETLSLFCFSTENWNRSQEEVSFLLDLMYKFVERQLERLISRNIRVRILGDLTKAPPKLLKQFTNCVELTKSNTGLNLNLFTSYGGRYEILMSAKEIAKKVASGEVSLEDVDEKMFSNHLLTGGMRDPDLIIRTSGEFRVSNFMLWQSAYSEYFITPKYWPDFTPDDLKIACEQFAARERRFGCARESEASI
jgi:undecaprenyl diphosphate synthase